MVESTGWFTIVIVAFISYGILGVVANAAELENPFGNDYNDLPLGRMADRIQEQVAHIYHTYRDRGYACIIQLPPEDLTKSECYWLNAGRPEPKADVASSGGKAVWIMWQKLDYVFFSEPVRLEHLLHYAGTWCIYQGSVVSA